MYHSEINSQDSDRFLKYIGFGEQDEAEAMLKINSDLALVSGEITDCAGRNFKQITGFQYAVWALDYHMWTMIKKYLNIEHSRAQVAELNTGSWIKTHGAQINLRSLIEALDVYVKNCEQWDWSKCNNHWCQEVGGAQLILPAHVINEYSHPSRPLAPCPKWNGQGEGVLPRTGVKDWKTGDYGGELGYTFAWVCGGVRLPTPLRIGRAGWCEVVKKNVMRDHELVSELLKSRTEQAQALVSELTLSQEVKPIINKYSSLTSIPKYNSQNLVKFLKHIGWGAQDEAEAMLKTNSDLALVPGNFSDCAERQFNQVTGFQYSVWALDWHMWTMIKKYMPTEAVKAQLIKLDKEGIDVKEPGASIYKKTKQVSWQNLIDALQKYIDNYQPWREAQCRRLWCKQVGGAQLILPAHVINEYSRRDRSYTPCPAFNELVLPRTGIPGWREQEPYTLGWNFAWVRGDRRGGCTDWGGVGKLMMWVGIAAIEADCIAVASLSNTRAEQRSQLIYSVTHTIDLTNPTPSISWQSTVSLNQNTTRKFKELPADALRIIISFCEIPILFSLRMVNKQFLNLPNFDNNGSYITNIKFLKCIGFGEQDKAEAMLRKNPNLALALGNFADCAERQFNQVTGFQYAVWALDWHMWTM